MDNESRNEETNMTDNIKHRDLSYLIHEQQGMPELQGLKLYPLK